MRPLDALFTPAEQRLMAAVMSNPQQDFGTLELLTTMGSSRSAGSAILQRWVDAGLLTERRVGNQRRLAANAEHLLFPELRRMALKTVGLAEPLARALRPVSRRLKEAFVFGSVAAGTDTAHSDIDLALVGDLDHFKVSLLLDRAQLAVGRPIHANIYSEEEWLSADTVISVLKSGPRIDLMEVLRAKAS